MGCPQSNFRIKKRRALSFQGQDGVIRCLISKKYLDLPIQFRTSVCLFLEQNDGGSVFQGKDNLFPQGFNIDCGLMRKIYWSTLAVRNLHPGHFFAQPEVSRSFLQRETQICHNLLETKFYDFLKSGNLKRL